MWYRKRLAGQLSPCLEDCWKSTCVFSSVQKWANMRKGGPGYFTWVWRTRKTSNPQFLGSITRTNTWVYSSTSHLPGLGWPRDTDIHNNTAARSHLSPAHLPSLTQKVAVCYSDTNASFSNHCAVLVLIEHRRSPPKAGLQLGECCETVLLKSMPEDCEVQ